MTVALSGYSVFFGNVLSELSLSLRAVVSKAARADFMRPIADDP